MAGTGGATADYTGFAATLQKLLAKRPIALRQPTFTIPGMDLKTLQQDALSLPAEDRAKLAETLLESLDVLPDAEIERLWLDEADRRAREIDEGKALLVPGEEVARKARALLR